MNRFSRYAGSKMHFSDKFNLITGTLDKKIYVEPFFGSGAIFFNLEKEYDEYVINDSNEHIVNCVQSFRDGDYDTYVKTKEKVFNEFGDIKANKESYYKLRDSFNVNLMGKKTVEEGFVFHFIMNSCINSMIRFGPNGVNQSFGNRFFFMKQEEFEEIKKRLQKKITFCSEDYKTIVSRYDSPDTLFFLDPPYFVRPDVGYTTSITENGLDAFIDLVKSLKGSVVYTDIACELHDRLGWYKEDTKMLTNISPLRKTQSSNQEVFFSNFEPELKREKSNALF